MWLSLRFRQVASAAEVQSLRRVSPCAWHPNPPRPTRAGDVCSREGENHARSPERRDEGERTRTRKCRSEKVSLKHPTNPLALQNISGQRFFAGELRTTWRWGPYIRERGNGQCSQEIAILAGSLDSLHGDPGSRKKIATDV